MDYERAIRLLESGTEMPGFPHTFEEMNEACKLAAEAMQKCIEYKTDRDHWKSRAEALEQALRFNEDNLCDCCINEQTIGTHEPCCDCKVLRDGDIDHFKFDEARFSDRQPDEPNQQQQ